MTHHQNKNQYLVTISFTGQASAVIEATDEDTAAYIASDVCRFSEFGLNTTVIEWEVEHVTSDPDE